MPTASNYLPNTVSVPAGYARWRRLDAAGARSTPTNLRQGSPLNPPSIGVTLSAVQAEGFPTPAAASAPLVSIVEDEVDIGDLIAVYLNGRGYRTRVFRGSVLAQSALTEENEQPALLITNCAMCELDGLELVRRCKQLRPNLKTLCASGSLTEDIVAAAEVKPDAMLQKPFSREELVAQVGALIGQAAAQPATG